MPRAVIIGRSTTCDVAVDNDTVSWRHASLQVLDDNAVEVNDLGSTNGTFILRRGGRTRVEAARLRRTDRVWFGEYEAVVDDLLRRAEARVAEPPSGSPEQPRKRWERGVLVRCEHCGAVKNINTKCPECSR